MNEIKAAILPVLSGTQDMGLTMQQVNTLGICKELFKVID